MQFNIGDARKHWDYLVAAVERGEEVVLALNGKSVAKIVREEIPKAKPSGSVPGRVEASRDAGLADESTRLDPSVPKRG